MSIMTVKDLKKKAPKGEFLAYINKEEADMLKRAGGSGHLVNGIPSFIGKDYANEREAKQAQKEGKKTPPSNPYGGSGQEKYKSNFTGPSIGSPDAPPTRKTIDEQKFNYNKQFYDKGQIGPSHSRKSIIQKHNLKKRLAYRQRLMENILKKQRGSNVDNVLGIEEYGPNGTGKYSQEFIDAVLSGQRPPPDYFTKIDVGSVPGGIFKGAATAANLIGPYMAGPVTKEKLNQLLSQQTALENFDPEKTTMKQMMEKYEPNRYKREYEPQDNDNNQPFIPINYNTGAAEGSDYDGTNQFTYDENAFGLGGDSADVTRASYNFNQGGRARRAEGGIMGLRARRAFGGIMDRVTGRKAYGLGSIFKSVKKAASKVLKSPIGKAALLYAGGTYLGGTAMFGGNAAAGSFGSRLMSPFGKNSFSKFLLNSEGKGILNRAGSLFSKDGALKKAGESMVGKETDTFADNALRFGKYLAPAYLLSKTKLGEAPPNELNLMTARANNKLVDPLNNRKSDPASMTATLNEALDNAGGDPDKIAAINKAYRFLNDRRLGDDGAKSVLVANGGRIRRAEGGLMDLGGMEKDYRNDGGFVPIGEYEKKDDVPARLSVNEFVFTADAVRGAGQGDIDKGAEIMENMMENLENGGTVSEESQGNKGAQQMFETSQRLGEVV